MGTREPAQMADLDERGLRIAELEAEVAALRAEIARRDEEDCRRAEKARYHKHRHALIGLGQWQAEVPVQPVRDHVLNVMYVSALSVPQVADLAGVSKNTVDKVLYDRAKKTVRTGIAEKLLTVTTATRLPETGLVPATGTTRRLQALSAAGHPLKVLAVRAGITYGNILKLRDGDRVSTTAGTARAVRGLYGELQLAEPAQDTRGERIAVAKTRSHAAEHGYAPAGAWDDDDIDDPDAQPHWEWVRDDGRRPKGAELAAEARELLRFGLNRELAAQRLGTTRANIDAALSRYPESASDGEVAA